MNNNNSNNEEYITLKDVFQSIANYWRYVLSKKWWILLISIIGGILFGLTAINSPKIYSEKLTFMMDEKSGEAVEGLTRLSGLFGGGQGNENLSKILELFESKKIIHNTLFDSIEIKGENDYLANHFLSQYGIEALVSDYKKFGILYKAYWPRTLLDKPDFRFQHSNIDSFTNYESLVLRVLFDKVAGNEDIGIPRLLKSSMDEVSGIMTITMKSEKQEITLGVLNNIYKHLSEFFIEKSTEKQTKTYNIIKEKKDSILRSLKTAEYQLADFKDSNRKLVTVKGYLKQLRLEREATILNVMYAEAVKQMEATDFALKNKTPVVQIIDLPRKPIIPQQDKFIGKFRFGLLLTFAVAVIYFVLRRFVKSVLDD